MKAILFDLDGTLIDSTEPIVMGFCAAFKAHNLSEPKNEQITALIGHTLEFMFEHLGAPKDEISSFIDVYKNTYTKYYLDGTSLIDGAKEALIIAKKHAKLAVVTTKTSENSKILLKHLGVSEFFDVIIGRSDVTNAKPDPEGILKALDILKVKPENSFMIGDTILDASAAKNANCTALGVLCGYGSKESLEQNCHKVFKNPKEAVKFIITNL